MVKTMTATVEEPIPEDVVWILVNEIVIAQKIEAPSPAR
jgi:hypothetical protein